MRIALRIGVALLVVGLAVVLLVGCGSAESDSDSAGDPTSGQTEEPTEESTDEPTEESSEPAPGESAENMPVDFTEIALVSESNVDATVSRRLTVLDTRRAREAFAGRIGNPRMTEALQAAYGKAQVSDGEVMVGAVVAVSCQPPAGLHVKRTDDGLRVTADPMKSKVQCIVPVTTVALLSVPEAAV